MNDDRISLPELALRDAPFHGRYPMKSVMCVPAHETRVVPRSLVPFLGRGFFNVLKKLLKGMEQ